MQQPCRDDDQLPPSTAQASSSAPLNASTAPRWLEPPATHLLYNQHAKGRLASYEPARTTLHFTFGSAVMIDFVKNWLHFAKKAGLTPYLVGASDGGLQKFCAADGVSAAAINPQLDVWTYELKRRARERARRVHAATAALLERRPTS